MRYALFTFGPRHTLAVIEANSEKEAVELGEFYYGMETPTAYPLPNWNEDGTNWFIAPYSTFVGLGGLLSAQHSPFVNHLYKGVENEAYLEHLARLDDNSVLFTNHPPELAHMNRTGLVYCDLFKLEFGTEGGVKKIKTVQLFKE